jgi:hypothetical protein
MNIPEIIIWIITLFGDTIEYGNGEMFWDYVGTNTEALCVEFCNYERCHNFVNYWALC